uniref:Uncharacterized protein n=1 Tax=Candidatus Kentrum sp. FW TaxID=2126338 RepID=A0A450U3G1_9GAMM|nr:MAG: hypothetical protein BECKFW1821C_GA0114237_11352 [Candidatus Kentron sp. FW]
MRKYTLGDIRLLARTDELHGNLSGPATKKIYERAWKLFKQAEYERLAGAYRNMRRYFDKTRPRSSDIGERRKPKPQGKPGYLRIDTIHQGDLDGIKGIYHINAADEVTQFECVCSTERISERYLIPVLEILITQFPFVIFSRVLWTSPSERSSPYGTCGQPDGQHPCCPPPAHTLRPLAHRAHNKSINEFHIQKQVDESHDKHASHAPYPR